MKDILRCLIVLLLGFALGCYMHPVPAQYSYMAHQTVVAQTVVAPAKHSGVAIYLANRQTAIIHMHISTMDMGSTFSCADKTSTITIETGGDSDCQAVSHSLCGDYESSEDTS